ncbi:MAG: AbgT family transporter [Candidatus Cloacimonetes bacterium]|nr:AbgT family transporter [Candidatus Cloacimonadota bacterium]
MFTARPGEEPKKIKELPHIFVILFCVIVIATIATYIIPAGQYQRVMDESINRVVIDPASFKFIPSTPVGIFDMFVAIELGLIDAASITFLIFAAFSCLFLLEKTGAIDASIALMVNKAKKTPRFATMIIVILMIALSIWGSTGTLSYEEIIAFSPIFVALSIALGYDALVGVGISVVPVGIGFASATVNPFTIGVAQTIAELPMFSGLGYRCIVLAVMTLFTIMYVLHYANKIKKNPEKSLVYGIDYSDLAVDETRMSTPFTSQRKLSILTLLIGVLIMGYGLIFLKWYINQVAAIFFIVSIAVGIINKWNANRIANTLCEGLSKGVLAAMIVGVARGILVVVTQGNILDTIIHASVGVLERLPLYASAIGMLVFQTFLNLLIPSGSGQAAVSMPIMAPIADLIHLNRQIAVLIFQFGDGFSNLLWPTSFMVIVCAMVKIPLTKYYRWITPFFILCFLIQAAFIFGAIAINYGPF